jgi:hypothetical protein
LRRRRKKEGSRWDGRCGFVLGQNFCFRQEVLVVVEDAKRKERGRVES